MNRAQSGTTSRSRLARASLPLLLVAGIAAQSQRPVQNPPQRPAKPPTTQTAPKPQPQQQATFRAGTDAFQTDVRVRDKAGNFVQTLKAEDFQVLEDGVEQKIASFWLWVGGRGVNSLVERPVTKTEGLILPTKRPPTINSGRVFIIFLDDLHILASNSIKARQVLKEVKN